MVLKANHRGGRAAGGQFLDAAGRTDRARRHWRRRRPAVHEPVSASSRTGLRVSNPGRLGDPWFQVARNSNAHLASNPGGISPLLTSVFPAAHGAITIEHVRAILACDVPVTPDIAQRIGRWAGNWLALWLSLQARWDSG